MTPREQDLYNYIVNFKKINGFAPSQREMLEGVNTKSFHHINTMLDHLEDEGFIRVNRKKSRSITVLKFIS